MSKRQKNAMALDFACIGVARAATSWVHQCLSEHPELCLANPKETKFFSIDDEFTKGAEYYARYFEHCALNSKRGEADPGYMYFRKALERIRAGNPRIKILIVLRHPVDRAWSHYKKHLLKGKQMVASKEEFITQTGNYYLRRSRYAKHLEDVFDLFPREQVLVLFYEAIKKDPSAFIQQIYLFVGADADFIPQSATQALNYTGYSYAKSLSLNRALYRVMFFFSKNSIARQFTPLLKTLRVHKLADMLRAWNMRHGGSKNPPAGPQLTKEDRKRLAPFLRSVTEETETVLQRNIPYWRNTDL